MLHRGQCLINRLSQINEVIQLLIIIIELERAHAYLLGLLRVDAEVSKRVDKLVFRLL